MSIGIADVRLAIADRPIVWPAPAEEPELLGYADGVQTIFTLRYENFIPGSLTLYQATPPAAASGKPPVWTAISPTPAAIIGTTSETAVVVPGGATITPVSMANIANGVPLLVDSGDAEEIVIASNCTGTTFQAIFAQAHLVGFGIQGSPTYITGNLAQNQNGTAASNATVTYATAPTPIGALVGARYQATAFSDADLQAYISRAAAIYPGDDVSTLKRVQYDIIDIVLMDYERMIILSRGDYRKDPSAYATNLRAQKASIRLDLSGGPTPGADNAALSIGGSSLRRSYEPKR